MTQPIFTLYRWLFGRKAFFRFNRLLFHCSLRGLGILNFESTRLSGEDHFLNMFVRNKKPFIVFDVGANVGKYTRAVRCLNTNSTIYAFEPHPLTYLSLVEATSDALFHPINSAVGATIGTFSLYDYAGSDGSEHASMFKEVIETIHGSPSIEHAVSMTTLDEFTKVHSIHSIDLLKIDTEGNELNVLVGAKRLLGERAISAIHFEFNEMNVESRSFLKDFWDLLSDYSLYRMLPDGLVRLERYSAVFCEIYAYQNIVALRQEPA